MRDGLESAFGGWRMSRRRFLGLGGAGASLPGAAGCGGDNNSGSPGRVMTVGYTDQDPVLALGVAPVAVREWFWEQPCAAWPWAQDELGDAEPEVLPAAKLSFEQIAGREPGLIVGVSAGMTGHEYETLSEIAPIIARLEEYVDFVVPRQEQTRIVGRALGRQQRTPSTGCSRRRSRNRSHDDGGLAMINITADAPNQARRRRERIRQREERREDVAPVTATSGTDESEVETPWAS